MSYKNLQLTDTKKKRLKNILISLPALDVAF